MLNQLQMAWTRIRRGLGGTGLAGFAAVSLLSGCVGVDLKSLTSKDLSETVLEKGEGWFGRDKVLLVDVSGVIEEGGGGVLGGIFGGSSCSPMYMKAVLRKAEDDSRIRGVVLRINSPGGTVCASEVIAREIAQFRKRTGIPVYAQINGMGCSGAYYIAAACDKINIQPSAISGSIGVIAAFPKYNKLADKVGIEEVVLKSGALKDIGNGMREMTEEERCVLQSVIDSSYENFLSWILDNRPESGNRETLKKAADGRIFTAQQALERKLVDRVCFLDDTLHEAAAAAKITKADVVTYGYGESSDANIYSPAGAAQPLRLGASLPGFLDAHTGFYYLWTPGK